MKRLIPMLLIAAMVVGALPAAAAGGVTIAGREDTASPGEQITVTLDLSGNPGIASWALTLEWDADALLLDKDSVRPGDGFSGGMLAVNSDKEGQIRLAWASVENATGDGALVTLTFTVSKTARPDSYPITVTASGVTDQDGGALTVTTADANVRLQADAPTQNEPAVQPPKEVDPVRNPFTDVAETAYYYQPVLWAAGQEITTGTAPDTFSPELVCDRAQALTFLWRAYGSPEPQTGECPFADVPEDAYYRKAVLWAVEQGITTGISETAFAPHATVTRAQMAAFLYRGVQAAGGGFQGAWMFRIPFTDLPEWAFEAIAWCYMKGITTGTSETTFSPDQPCTRGQIVTFLYRAFAEQEN
ncbi:MAG: S-layer homology domain-containing protein [Clostridia bacterium]|nr:S-layer homology domain-containing protein [Clostridia bacterium]